MQVTKNSYIVTSQLIEVNTENSKREQSNINEPVKVKWNSWLACSVTHQSLQYVKAPVKIIIV